MTSRLNPYINFDGSAKQALEFYAQVFGGTPAINTFGEFGMPGADADKVMHGQLETTLGFTLMCSDAPEGRELATETNITVSLSGDDEAELRGYWDALADGGSVMMPLEKQMWGDTFGMCTDKFGVPWLVNITPGS